MSQLFAMLTYAAVLGNVFFAAFLSATPADHPMPWWAAAVVAALNALVHALPSAGLPLPVALPVAAPAAPAAIPVEAVKP